MKLPCEAHTQVQDLLVCDGFYLGYLDFYLGSVVHHHVGAAHSFGAFAWWDAQMVTAAVAHGQKAECAPPLFWEDEGELHKQV